MQDVQQPMREVWVRVKFHCPFIADDSADALAHSLANHMLELLPMGSCSVELMLPVGNCTVSSHTVEN